MQLKNKKALVTGASGGIGAAIVRRLQAEGATVTGTDLTPSDADFHIAGNLMDAEFCDALPAQAMAKMGGLDILINNAGIITRGDITQASDADLQRTMASKLT